MNCVAWVAILLGIASTSAAEPSTPDDPAVCEELALRELNTQLALFGTQEHADLRDTAIYRAWFTTSGEAGLMYAPEDSAILRMETLQQRLAHLEPQLKKIATELGVLQSSACARVTKAAKQARQKGCFSASVIAPWTLLDPCISLQTVFYPPPSVLAVPVSKTE